jgi:hypothetical protein
MLVVVGLVLDCLFDAYFLFLVSLLIDLLYSLNLRELLLRSIHLVLDLGSSEKCGIEFQLVRGLFSLSEREPLFAVVSIIESLADLTIGKDVHTLVVLLAPSPVTEVCATIDPHVDTEPILLVLEVLSVVHSSILPLVSAHPVHHVVLPLAHVHSAVAPQVDAVPTDSVILPVTKVLVAIGPGVYALSLLLRVNVVAMEL